LYSRRSFRAAVRRRSGGFTLIELMIALAIAAILLLLAVPGYQAVILKSNRAAAKGVLVSVLSRQEQYFVNNKGYATSLESLGLPVPYYIDRQAAPATAGAAVYRIELDIVAAAYSGVTAVPVNRQTADSPCMAYSISRLGVRAVSGALSASPVDCW
jgi:type IV pilus assembly protein PilE